jgi:hypothetical protein
MMPPSEESREIDGNELQLGPQHVQNRINAYVSGRSRSKSRRKRIRQTLSNLYDRVCAAVHDDISAEEAMALVLQTYVILGEIAIMAEDSISPQE